MKEAREYHWAFDFAYELFAYKGNNSEDKVVSRIQKLINLDYCAHRWGNFYYNHHHEYATETERIYPPFDKSKYYVVT